MVETQTLTDFIKAADITGTFNVLGMRGEDGRFGLALDLIEPNGTSYKMKGWGRDVYGYFNFNGVMSPDKVEFRKEYNESANKDHEKKDVIFYKGVLIQEGIYAGSWTRTPENWISAGLGSLFVLNMTKNTKPDRLGKTLYNYYFREPVLKNLATALQNYAVKRENSPDLFETKK